MRMNLNIKLFSQNALTTSWLFFIWLLKNWLATDGGPIYKYFICQTAIFTHECTELIPSEANKTPGRDSILQPLIGKVLVGFDWVITHPSTNTRPTCTVSCPENSNLLFLSSLLHPYLPCQINFIPVWTFQQFLLVFRPCINDFAWIFEDCLSKFLTIYL